MNNHEQHAFSVSGISYIDHLVPAEEISTLRNWFQAGGASWRWVFFPDPDRCDGKPTSYVDDESEALRKLILMKRAYLNRECFTKEKFSFIYRRSNSDTHDRSCSCPECAFISRSLFNSSNIAVIQEVTGLRNLELGECFVSNYSEGDFNGVHNDAGKGDVAFVYSLSPSWLSMYGGEFLRFAQDGRTIIDRAIPVLGRLILFDVRDQGVPHMVTHVRANAPNRISITGWLTERKAEVDNE